ncbi:MAG TPA: FhaA domain-containing protein [Candidatus Limnocylindrales bacterium]
MASFADVERFFERVFERSSATLFRTRIQAVQLEHRVERAMERARAHQGSRTVVPARYRVGLNPDDLAALAPESANAVALASRLADAALAFARAHAYYLPARPVVVLVADPSLARGQVEVDVGPVQPASPGVEPASVAPVVAQVAVAAATDASPLEVVAEGIRGDGTQTFVFRRPAPPPARALIRVCAPDGTERTIEVDGTPIAIGRAQDNRLVLLDRRVSRLHGRLQARRGTLVYTDLGSTNGSRVNGIRVDEIALGLGDRVQVGDTVLVVETLPG